MTEENNNDNVPKINLPESEIPMHPLTMSQIEHDAAERISRIDEEFKKGFDFIKHHPKSVTFFGSARLREDNKHYQKAREIARRVSEEGYAVVTGGGPGIMEAANRGAYESEAGNDYSLGVCIKLPHEQATNPYVTNHRDFKYFFTRKVVLSFSAEAYVYFPGGFGTMDEFFEIITLIQTHKIEKVPIILVGTEFWEPLRDSWKKILLDEHHTVNETDFDLFTITDDEEKIMEIIKSAPLRQE